jgi:Fur family ferric uptake transcriptional regulator
MSTETTASILKKNGLSITDTRATILSLFKDTDGALAHADIEKKAGKQFDRVTIYRTLQTFVDKGIIHTIPTADNSVKYALCKEACTTGHHNHQHIHFICDVCAITYCLHVHDMPHIQLPQGFLPKQQDIIISGVCKKCNS